jgi:hypothetical protein
MKERGQFNFIVQERKMADVFWDSLAQDCGAHVWSLK